MNGHQFMGLRIRFDDRGGMKRAWQSIRKAPDSMVEDAGIKGQNSMTSHIFKSMASIKIYILVFQ